MKQENQAKGLKTFKLVLSKKCMNIATCDQENDCACLSNNI